jgi:hypothetical protein
VWEVHRIDTGSLTDGVQMTKQTKTKRFDLKGAFAKMNAFGGQTYESDVYLSALTEQEVGTLYRGYMYHTQGLCISAARLNFMHDLGGLRALITEIAGMEPIIDYVEPFYLLAANGYKVRPNPPQTEMSK